MSYVPNTLTPKDKRKQLSMLKNSIELYKQKRFYTRAKLPSFTSKTSKHILKARKMYSIKHIRPSKALSRASGCPMHVLEGIVKKGEGAYYSSGSRPNQTPQSWGLARLASAVTGGKASKVDFSILKEGCSHSGKAFRLAKKNL
jgi:hypothetical protein